MEPILQANDIQGHIFPGFASQVSAVVGLRLDNPVQGRKAMLQLVPYLTRMEMTQEAKRNRRNAFTQSTSPPPQFTTFLSVSFAASALDAWGEDLSVFDPSFAAGMHDEAGELGDPLDDAGQPLDWIFGLGANDRIDALLVVGNTTKDAIVTDLQPWLDALSPSWQVVFSEYGGRRMGDKEFFGFNDGVSQPALRGFTPDGEYVSRRVIEPTDSRYPYFAKPGQRLIWPGQFLFGYPVETSDPLVSGNIQTAPITWMHNGSYLVFRRLIQRIDLFDSAVASLEEYLRKNGETVPDGWVASRLVGRWPDGTPLIAAPNSADSNISGNVLRINNFQYGRPFTPTPVTDEFLKESPLPAVEADLVGNKCPFAAHIRKVNPRDGLSEIGPELHSTKMILRRGIVFGPETDQAPNADRGLIFLSFQTSIVEQFKFLQRNWASSSQRPTNSGLDPIIGQDGSVNTKRRLTIFAPSGRQLICPFDGRWVIPTGGGYFVTPGIAGLNELLST